MVINSYEAEPLKELLDSGGRVKIYTSIKDNIEHKNIIGLCETSLEINAIVIDHKICGMAESIRSKQVHSMTQ